MAEKVATIHGGRIPNTPSDEVVATLERLLLDAKAGNLVALAYAVVREGNGQSTGWDGEAGTRHTLGTAIAMLQHRYVGDMLEGDL